MDIDPREVEKRTARFEQACRAAGIKLTHQRLEIFREVAQAGDHPDAETVHRRVRERMPTVSMDTIYRTLWLLNDLGMVHTLGPSRESTRFDANMARHHHFVCTKCGGVQDFCEPRFDRLTPPKGVKELGTPDSLYVEVRGTCKQCEGKEDANDQGRR